MDVFGLVKAKQLTEVDFLNSLDDLQAGRITKLDFYRAWGELFDGTVRSFGEKYPIYEINKKVNSCLASLRRIYQFSGRSRYPAVKSFGLDLKRAYAGKYRKWTGPAQADWQRLVSSVYPPYFLTERVKNPPATRAYLGYYLKLLIEIPPEFPLEGVRAIFNACRAVLEAEFAYFLNPQHWDEGFAVSSSRRPLRISFLCQFLGEDVLFQSAWMDFDDFSEFAEWFKKLVPIEPASEGELKSKILLWIRPISPVSADHRFLIRPTAAGRLENRESIYLEYR